MMHRDCFCLPAPIETPSKAASFLFLDSVSCVSNRLSAGCQRQLHSGGGGSIGKGHEHSPT